jgi:heme/copper-type cytochrome/quinol oxidase subunit 2
MVIANHAHLIPMQPDATMRRLDHLYWAAGTVAAHPISAVVVALIVVLLIVGGVIWLLVLSVRRIRRKKATSPAR